MSRVMYWTCDGCSAELGQVPLRRDRGQRERLIHGERTNGMRSIVPLPSDKFDWCEDCAKIAFTAVKAANRGVASPSHAPAQNRPTPSRRGHPNHGDDGDARTFHPHAPPARSRQRR